MRIRTFRSAVTFVATLTLAIGLGAAMSPALAEQSSSATLYQAITCPDDDSLLVGLDTVRQPAPLPVSETEQIGTSSLALQAGVNGCRAAGWKVTMQASALTPASPGLSPIAAGNVRLARTGQITPVRGQVDPLPTGLAVSAALPLDAARQVMTARPNAGLGLYRQAIDLQVVVPAYTAPDTYATVVTVTITTGP